MPVDYCFVYVLLRCSFSSVGYRTPTTPSILQARIFEVEVSLYDSPYFVTDTAFISELEQSFPFSFQQLSPETLKSVGTLFDAAFFTVVGVLVQAGGKTLAAKLVEFTQSFGCSPTHPTFAPQHF